MIEIIKHGTKRKINNRKKTQLKKQWIVHNAIMRLYFLMKLLFNESSD
jgi:hypothetical protein